MTEPTAEDAAHVEVPVARNALVTAVAQVGSMMLAAVLAVLIVAEFGKNASTDGLFAAYGVYGFLLLVAQSVRTTVVARLLEGSLQETLHRYLGAMLAIFLASGIPFVVLGGPMARLLTGSLGSGARHAAQSALIYFWVAAGAQLVSGLAAAALATKGEFGVPSVAYLAGSAVPIVSIELFSHALGRNAVTVGIAVGSALTAGVLLIRLATRGDPVLLGSLVRARRTGRALVVVLAGSFGFLIAQLAYVISLAFAARLTAGAVTLYTYAFFAASALLAATAGPATVVIAAPLAATWDRGRAWLEPYVIATFRAGLTLVIPVLGIAAVAGQDVADLVLGRSLTHGDERTLVLTFLAFSGMLISSLASPVPMLAAFASSRYGPLAVMSSIAIALHVALSLAAYRTGDLEWLAAAGSASALASLAMLLVIVYGRETPGVLVVLGRELVRVAGVAAAAFGLALGLRALVGGGLGSAVGALLGVGCFVVLVRVVLPANWELVRRFSYAVPGRTKRNKPQA